MPHGRVHTLTCAHTQLRVARALLQLRPTKLPYSELYSLEGATHFVVNAIKYEPFENELHLPDFLLSPQSTLAFQAGDSLDMATLLVSILAGAGFDAYVVVGYAPPEVVRNDQSGAVCPLLEAEAVAAERPAQSAAPAGAAASAAQPKYTCAATLADCGTAARGVHARSHCSTRLSAWARPSTQATPGPTLQDQAGARL